jgi:hypothetical protein
MSQPQSNTIMMTTAQVAELLGTGTSSELALTWLRSHGVQGQRVGAGYQFSEADVKRAIAGATVTATRQPSPMVQRRILDIAKSATATG